MTSNVLIINQGGERMTLDALKKSFYQIKGKTIALVYTFQGDTSNGLEHFFIWKSNLLIMLYIQ